jgi:hypothetical protein
MTDRPASSNRGRRPVSQMGDWVLSRYYGSVVEQVTPMLYVSVPPLLTE